MKSSTNLNMESTPTSQTIFQPNFTETETALLKEYFEFNEKYYWQVNKDLTAKLAQHPLWGPILKMQTPEQQRQQNEHSLEIQRAAIYEGKWDEYTKDLITQGVTYARMNVKYSDWYEIIKIYKDYLLPYIKQDFAGNTTQALNVISGLSILIDYAMYGIAEAYFEEKNEIIRQMNAQLEKRVEERTAELATVNKELEAFTYSVSHDLRAPLRAVNGYAQMLNEDYGTKLDEEGKRIIETIRHNAMKMGTLIDELLAFSQLGRKEVQRTKIDMDKLVEAVFIDMDKSFTHKAEIKIGKLHHVEADYGLLMQVMFNLISNALKYSSKKEHPIVEIFSEKKNGAIIFSVKDNGAGFDMKYYDKLFGVFQRLHKQNEFEGTGVGLAIVQRVITKHGGKVWAEGKVNEGAQFYFSLTIN